MGILSWLIGKKKTKAVNALIDTFKPVTDSRQDRSYFPADKYASNSQPYSSDWVHTTMRVKVQGVQYRYEAIDEFIAAALDVDIEENGIPYGVRLKPEPSNPKDKNAIAVYGYVGNNQWHVGYLDKYTAQEINEDLISKGIPIDGHLLYVWVGNKGFVDINITVLAPKGNSAKVRLKRRKAET